jgi:hypothetical protein
LFIVGQCSYNARFQLVDAVWVSFHPYS